MVRSIQRRARANNPWHVSVDTEPGAAVRVYCQGGGEFGSARVGEMNAG